VQRTGCGLEAALFDDGLESSQLHLVHVKQR
jgi:hypothetical protein